MTQRKLSLSNGKREKAQSYIGKKLARLLILEVVSEKASGGRTKVRCLCDCGKEVIKIFTLIKQGHTNSCGCYNQDQAREMAKIAQEKNLASGKWNKDPKIKTAKHVFEAYSDGDLTFDIFLELSQQNCFYCGEVPSNCYNWYIYKKSGFTDFRKKNGYFTYNGLDRVDNTQLHNLNNIVPCCVNCNRSKSARTQQDFIKWVEKTYLHLRSKNLI